MSLMQLLTNGKNVTVCRECKVQPLFCRGVDDEGGNGLHGRVLSTFLNELDGVTSANDKGFENSVMVLAACADVATLDEALVRPG